MKKFKQELEELLKKHAVRFDETHGGYLAEFRDGEYMQIDMFYDSNDLDDFKSEKILYLCDKCDEMYEDHMSDGQCCEGATIREVDAGDMDYQGY